MAGREAAGEGLMGEVEWGPAVSFLVGGIVVGAFILWRFVRTAPTAPSTPFGGSLEQRDLRARFEALIGQLRELEDTGAKRTEAQHREERSLLELQAARTLLALDGLAPAASKGKKMDATVPVPARGSSLAGFFWGIGTATAIGLLLFFVSQASKQRDPGGSVTGNTPTDAGGRGQGGGGGEGEAGAAEIRTLEARLRQNPEDLDARLDLARLHLMQEDMMAVFNDTQAVLQRDATNPRALSYQSLVRLAMGQGGRAEEMLVQALRKDPDLLEGYLHLMFVYTRLGKPQQADDTLARAAARFPDRAPVLRQALAQMRAASGEAGEPPSAATQAARGVAGVIDLDPTARASLRPGTVLFITLRESGFGAGPPLAARRLVPPSFPVPFEIGQGDSMRGDRIPDLVLVEARLDTDGDPITRPPSDPYGRQDDVRVGTRDLRLVLSPHLQK